MEEKQFSWQSKQFEQQETFFRLINPEDYSRYGIDSQDVPMGTFAAEDHPSFLPSRFGGNAYGLGLIEQSVLNDADTDFLESLDFQEVGEIGRYAKRLNEIYQKLGLLIRFGATGKSYFLIPINLVAHSLQEIKTKADEIEELIIQHIFETRTERLDVGLLTSGQDLIVHELTARLSSHRIFLFESLAKLRSWRMSLDIVILPKDPLEYLLEQKLPRASKRPLTQQMFNNYAMYLAGKIYDILDPEGKVLVLAHSPGPKEEMACMVRFKSEEDMKTFLLFSHTFKTKKKYEGRSLNQEMEVHISDLHYYLNRFTFFEPHLRRLLDHQKPEDLSTQDINKLPYLNLRIPQPHLKNPEKKWKWIFEPYFSTSQLKRKSPRQQHRYWQDRLEIDPELPESLLVLVGKPRQPAVALTHLEEEIRLSGMEGCSLPLVAEYRNTLRYLLDVLKILGQIRDHKLHRISDLEQTRLSTPFRSKNASFSAVLGLLARIPKLEKIGEMLNPDGTEGPITPVLENIPKLSLLGFPLAQLREILLIVVGHTTMSRVAFAKLPATTLKPITDRVQDGGHHEVLDLLRVCHLMSLAEIIAALGGSFTEEQAKELRRLYDDIVWVATDPGLDWEKLHDLRISTLGGVQNKAIREMMKFFNLFEFLDDWQEAILKGPFQKEVLCDYEPETLHHLQELLDLAQIADQFKREFLGDYIFGQSYFFRQFLETEFHGTGHLFPQLGTRAGFVLLWIAVNSSQRHIINFNPMLAGISLDRHDQRINKIKESLLLIPIEMLRPGFFEEIKKDFAEGRPAFIFDSGIRLINNVRTRAIDLSFVDVEENIQQVEALLTLFGSQMLRGISLKNLEELERRFSELESFRQYLQRKGCYLQCDVFDASPEGRGGSETADKGIGEIEERLKQMLLRQIFVPEEIYETINALVQHCPEILRFILPEFHALGNLFEQWPMHQKQSLGNYVMRCLEKFQALVIKDRGAFQDPNTFYQLAKQEFGPLAEEGIGATHSQMDILEYLVERIQQKPMLYQALTVAPFFQEIGKIDQYASLSPEIGACLTHPKRGALILERCGILERYRLDPQVGEFVIFLVRFHGLIGRVIQGEEPATALEIITAMQDNYLLDVFVLDAILSAAAVREGLMVSDLLEAFLTYRSNALQIIKSKGDWQIWLKETLREKGAAVLAYFQLTPRDKALFTAQRVAACGFDEGGDEEDEALWHGRQSAALERLLKLLGTNWVDCQDVQMFLLKMPVNFVYHKKKLKSVGLATFDKQLRHAVKVLEAISALTPEVRYYFLYCLDHLGGAMRIYGFHPLTESLELEESLKLLLISFQAFHNHFGAGARSGLVSFKPLSQNILRRREALKKLLKDLPFPQACFQGGEPVFSPQGYGGLHFEKNDYEPALQVDFKDAVEFDMMTHSLTTIWNHDELKKRHAALIDELQEKLPYDTRNFEEELLRVFEEQQRKINDRILKTFQKRLDQAASFSALREIQKEILHTHSEVSFSEEQQFLQKEMFEFHRSRLRDRYLDSIYQEINEFKTKESLSAYWNGLKYELFQYRSYVGKEYESLIARFIDEKMETMQS